MIHMGGVDGRQKLTEFDYAEGWQQLTTAAAHIGMVWGQCLEKSGDVVTLCIQGGVGLVR